MQVNYRIAKTEDISNIKALTDQMLAHTDLGVATVPKITALVNSPKTLFMLAMIEDKLVGYTCGILHENIFNDVMRVTDIGIFVLPEYRKHGIDQSLLLLLESWAKENKANQLWLGQTTGDAVDKIAEYYRKQGFKVCGFNAVKDL